MTKILSTLILTAAFTLPAFSGGEAERVTADVKTGTTVITFNDTIADALDTVGVIFKKAQPARINPGKGSLTFVASGGAIDLANGKTEIINSGGVTLAIEVPTVPIEPMAPKTPKQYKTATILDPIVVLSETGAVTEVKTISAIIVVNGVSLGRLNVFTIDDTVLGTTPITLPKNGKITASDLSLKLTAEAVTALNEALGVPAFTADTEIGEADINVKIAPVKL
jgi:hypothetical protein